MIVEGVGHNTHDLVLAGNLNVAKGQQAYQRLLSGRTAVKV